MREQEEKKKVGMNIHDVSIATSIKKKNIFCCIFLMIHYLISRFATQPSNDGERGTILIIETLSNYPKEQSF